MEFKAAVITVSDKGFAGERKDTSGPALKALLEGEGYSVIHCAIVPDDRAKISAELIKCADELGCSLVLTTGGTGFSQRDITPEATLDVVERLAPGLPEAMRAESMKITPRGCLSRETAGIRGKTLIVNLPGSEKAAKENIMAVLGALDHGLEMLCAEGSTDHIHEHAEPKKEKEPSMDEWLREAKADPNAGQVGMYLTHNGVVRKTARALVRSGDQTALPVTGMEFGYDSEKLEQAVAEARKLTGVYYVRAWLNQGLLQIGDSIMYVMVGADTRPHAMDALNSLVGEIKSRCVEEKELY